MSFLRMLSLLFFVIATLTWDIHAMAGEKKPLSLEDLTFLIKNEVVEKRIASLVRERGIDFFPTDEDISNLKRLGLTQKSLKIIREKGEANRAGLIVNSVPQSAKIFIDGKQRGITPAIISHLAPGKIEVKIGGVEGYEDQVILQDLGPGEKGSLIVRLEPKNEQAPAPVTASVSSVAPSPEEPPPPQAEPVKPQTREPLAKGTLFINTEPPGAKIYIDGQYKALTPAQVHAETGGHTLVLLKENYSFYQESVVIDEDMKIIDVRLRLSPK